MKIDPVRLKRQAEVVRTWGNNFNGQGTLQAVTGFGKTMVGRIAYRWLLQYKGQDSTVIVVVPSLVLKEQWEAIAADSQWGNYEVWTIQSFIKRDIVPCDLLILDEIQMYKAHEFRKCFSIANYFFVLGLTAHLDKDDPRQEIIDEFAPLCDIVTMEQALDGGWVSPYRIYNLGIELDEATRKEYNIVSQAYGKCVSFFDHDFSAMMACYTNKPSRERKAREKDMPANEVFLMARKGALSIRRRKEILYNYNGKLDTVVEICREHPERKIITFGQTIDSAEYINTQLGPVAEAYHSKIKSRILNGKKVGPAKVKKDILERFCKPDVKLNVLSTAKSMDMGVDIPLLDTGICYAGASKVLQNIQRIGRVVRKQKGKMAIWIEIYILDSQDVRWLLKRQESLPRDIVHHIRHSSEILWN